MEGKAQRLRLGWCRCWIGRSQRGRSEGLEQGVRQDKRKRPGKRSGRVPAVGEMLSTMCQDACKTLMLWREGTRLVLSSGRECIEDEASQEKSTSTKCRQATDIAAVAVGEVESRVSSCRGGGVVQGPCPNQGLRNALCSLCSPGIATTNQTRFASARASPALLKHDLAVPGCACRVRVQTTVPLPATRQFTTRPARERQRAQRTRPASERASHSVGAAEKNREGTDEQTTARPREEDTGEYAVIRRRQSSPCCKRAKDGTPQLLSD